MRDFLKKLEIIYKNEIKNFPDLLKKIPYEDKGIPHSEIFFIYCLIKKNPPERIIESGRARGQSTIALAKLFPKSKIISIERDRESLDAKIAASRLKNVKNVTCLFGDSKKILPKICKKGRNDIVLIDGPKGFRAIRLALSLLRYKNVSSIFMHDNTYGSKERDFLEKKMPHVKFSDHQLLTKISHKLDKPFKSKLPIIYNYTPKKHYGASVTLIENNRTYNTLLLRLITRIIDLTSAIQRRKFDLMNFFQRT
jgi:hypothetical protein